MATTTGDKKKYKLTNKQVDKTVDSPCIKVCTYDEEKIAKRIKNYQYLFYSVTTKMA